MQVADLGFAALRSLRTSTERPRNRRATKKTDELPSLHRSTSFQISNPYLLP